MATVSSTTPSPAPKCPPVIDTASISSARSSSASWRKSDSGSFRRSAGVGQRSSSGVRFEIRALGFPSKGQSSRSAAKDEPRQLPQKFRSLVEQIKMHDRLIDQQLRLGAGPLNPKDRHEGGLAGGGVGADRLAGLRRRTLDVEQVVGDLEGEAEIVGIAAQRLARLVRGLGENRPRFAGEGDQRPGL